MDRPLEDTTAGDISQATLDALGSEIEKRSEIINGLTAKARAMCLVQADLIDQIRKLKADKYPPHKTIAKNLQSEAIELNKKTDEVLEQCAELIGQQKQTLQEYEAIAAVFLLKNKTNNAG